MTNNFAEDGALLRLIAGAREEQRRAVCSREPLIVVSAGAGTGKTRTLAWRFAWLLATDPTCGVDRILTLTFTEAAAREMRDRIRATLADWHKSDPAGLAHLKDAVDRIDEAYISTIHSFSMRVIRESGLALEIDPAATIVDAPTEEAFWNEFEWKLATLASGRVAVDLPAAWRARAAELFGDPAFGALVDYYGADVLAAAAKGAGELHGSMGRTPEYLWNFNEAADREVAASIAETLAPRWRAAWDLWLGEALPGAGSAFELDKTASSEKLRALYKTYRNAERSRETEKNFFVELVGSALKNPPGNAKWKTAVEASIEGGMTNWRKSMEKIAELSAGLDEKCPYGPEETRARRLLLRCAAVGWAAWEEQRRRSGALSFDDLIRYAGEALSSEAGAGYAEQFRHILIDEFQDTDGLQDRLLRSLSEGWRPGEGKTLFIVGDIKQSIYRFRHAEPRLFAGYIAQTQTREGGRYIALDCSYRMRESLVDGVNEIFSFLWRDGVIEGTTLAYEELRAPDDSPLWKARNEGDGGLEMLLAIQTPDEEGKKESLGALRARLGEALAGRFAALHAGSNVWDKDEGAQRAARWSDFAVLVPSRVSYNILEEIFAAASIPAVFIGSQSYLGRGEVQDAIIMLAALADPDDALALAGWIASPFSGLPHDALLPLLADGPKNLWTNFSAAHPEAAALFEKRRNAALVAGPGAVLKSLVEERGWLAAYPPSTRLRVLANMARGAALVGEYEASMGSGLAGCVDYLRRSFAKKARVEEPSHIAPSEDAVRVMTIHASKGLEFPVVAIFGMEQNFGKNKAAPVIPSRKLGVVAATLPPEGEPGALLARSVSGLRHAFLEKRDDMAERERHFYVAATRAQDRLIFCGAADRDKNDALVAKGGEEGNTWLDWVLRINEEKNICGVRIAGEDSKTEQDLGALPQTPQGDVIPLTPVMGASVARLCACPSIERFSASAYALYRWCPYAYRVRYRQGRELAWQSPDGEGFGGSVVGSIAHRILMKWDFSARGLDSFLPEAGDSLETAVIDMPMDLRAEFRKARTRRFVRRWLEAFSESDVAAHMRSLVAEKKLRREIAFRVQIEEITLIGSMDVYWEDETGSHIRDWKTTPKTSAPREFYARQLDFYGAAALAATGRAPLDAELIYVRHAPYEGAPSPARDWKSVTEDILAAAASAVNGPFAPQSDHCARCPWRCDERR